MRLRYALVLALLAGAAGALLVGLDLTYRIRELSGPDSASSILGPQLLASLGTSYLVVLVAIAVANLAALLLLAAAFREERMTALLRAQQPPEKPAPGHVGPLAGQDQKAGDPTASGHRSAVAWPWGELVPWKPEYGRPFAELWNRACKDLYGACPKEWKKFEKLLESPEFDPVASAAAQGTDGTFFGAILALRQPNFEDDGYWWLESPGVIAAFLLEPNKRNQGIGKALLQHAESVAVRRKRPRIFVGGLENFPHLVPGVPDQDHGTRMFLTSLGYREVRRTCHMEADFKDFKIPPDLVEREKNLEGDGYTFAAAEENDRDAFNEFLDASNLSRKTRRREKFETEWSRYFFALKDGKIVGFIQVTAKDDRGHSGIHLIYFLRAHRGVGLGSVLLNKAHELWKKMGASGGTIWTYPEAAARFYPRAGFRTVQEWVCFEKDLQHSWSDPEYVNRWR